MDAIFPIFFLDFSECVWGGGGGGGGGGGSGGILLLFFSNEI